MTSLLFIMPPFYKVLPLYLIYYAYQVLLFYSISYVCILLHITIQIIN